MYVYVRYFSLSILTYFTLPTYLSYKRRWQRKVQMCKQFQWEAISKVFAMNLCLIFLVIIWLGDIDRVSITYFWSVVLHLLNTCHYTANITINVFYPTYFNVFYFYVNVLYTYARRTITVTTARYLLARKLSVVLNARRQSLVRVH